MVGSLMLVIWSLLCVVAGVYIGANNPKIASKLPGIKNRAV